MYKNLLEYIVKNLDTASAESRIYDIDVAKEETNATLAF